MAIDAAAPQASDRVYYLYQTMADISEALSSSPEGAAALESAQRQVAALAAPQQAQQQHAEAAQQQQQQPQPAGKAGKKAAAAAASSPGVELLAEVRAALADDFNTPLAIAALSAPLKAANDLLHTKKVGCCFCCWMQPCVLTGCCTRLASIAPRLPCQLSCHGAGPLSCLCAAAHCARRAQPRPAYVWCAATLPPTRGGVHGSALLTWLPSQLSPAQGKKAPGRLQELAFWYHCVAASVSNQPVLLPPSQLSPAQGKKAPGRLQELAFWYHCVAASVSNQPVLLPPSQLSPAQGKKAPGRLQELAFWYHCVAASVSNQPVLLPPSQLSPAQGKKAPGRLQELASIQAGLQSVLELLGLWAEQPAAVLGELRALALTR